jgi:hypothetical protein
MRLRLSPAPDYFVASPGITVGCVEKLNTFKPIQFMLRRTNNR